MLINGLNNELKVKGLNQPALSKPAFTAKPSTTAITNPNLLNFLGHVNYISFGAKAKPASEEGVYPQLKIKIRADRQLAEDLKPQLRSEATSRIQGKPFWKKTIARPNVWMVTAETSTFMKTGGLGDVAVDLPEAFNNKYNKGPGAPKMTIVQPLYESGDLVKIEKTGENTYKYTSKPMGNTSIDLVDTGVKIQVPVGKGKTTTVSVLKGTLNGTEYRFLRNEEFFGKLPNDGKKVTPYVKNESGVGESERFAFLSKAVAYYVKELKEKGASDAPDVIDANDWHAGPLAAQFRYLMQAKAAKNDGISKEIAQELKDLPIVYTVHNLEYQGWDHPNTSKILDLLYEGYANDIFKSAYTPKMENTQKVNDITNKKSVIVRDTYNAAMHGLALADAVVAVSPNYSNEIASHNFYGYDFVDLLSERQKHGNLIGIVNGIGQDGIAPDGALAKRVNAKFDNAFKLYHKSMSPSEIKAARQHNKKTFIQMIQNGTIKEKLGLDSTDGNNLKDFDITKIDETPLLTVVSRLEGQKGVDIIASSIKNVLDHNPAPGKPEPLVVILGTGNDAAILNKLKEKLTPEQSKQVVFYNAFSVDLMHMTQTAGDMFLMPSKFEPCGLGQLQAMAKGNIPVATATGGLADTIEEGKTGFLSKYDPDNLKQTKARYTSKLAKIIKMFHQDRSKFDEVAYNALVKDFSWEESGSLDKYFKLFQTGNIEGKLPKRAEVA